MKAVVFDGHSETDVLEYKDIPDPEVSPGEVLVKVKAASANYNDIWARRGLPGVQIILPHVSGSDIAGEIGSDNICEPISVRRQHALNELGHSFRNRQRTFFFVT